jgi:hypothetical protein
MTFFIICILEERGNHLKENKLGEACSTYGKDEKFVLKLNLKA